MVGRTFSIPAANDTHAAVIPETNFYLSNKARDRRRFEQLASKCRGRETTCAEWC
jgi:hypothetical protein